MEERPWDWGFTAGSGPGGDEAPGDEGSGEEDRDSTGEAGRTFWSVGLSGPGRAKEWIKSGGVVVGN